MTRAVVRSSPQRLPGVESSSRCATWRALEGLGYEVAEYGGDRVALPRGRGSALFREPRIEVDGFVYVELGSDDVEPELLVQEANESLPNDPQLLDEVRAFTERDDAGIADECAQRLENVERRTRLRSRSPHSFVRRARPRAASAGVASLVAAPAATRRRRPQATCARPGAVDKGATAVGAIRARIAAAVRILDAMAIRARAATLLVAACACIIGCESGPSSPGGKRPLSTSAPSLAATPASAHAVADAHGSAAQPEAPTCGDGTCNVDESCSSCPNDCGACSPGSGGAGGAPGTQTSWPCTRCITTVPASYDPTVPMPLVVSLHGDEGSPRSSHGIWKRAALDNGYILMSPACPRELGCTGRWGTGSWHRDGPAGSVAWLDAQIDAVEAAYNIDRSRIYLVGGSRGSVYIGFHADAFAPRIAGVAMYAGGYSSLTSTCAPCALPVYILVGRRDFLHDIARKARGWFRGCGSEVVFDELPGVAHRGIAKALLQGKANTILAWFSARPNACLPALSRAGGSGG